MYDDMGFDRDKWDERVEMSISLGDLLLLHGQIALALRQPNNNKTPSERARAMLHRIELLLSERGMFEERFIKKIHKHSPH